MRPALVLVLLLAMALAVLWPRPAAAQDAPDAPDVTITVAAGLQGYVKYSEWLALRVRLENHGADLVGEVTTDIASAGGSVGASVSVELPAGARKELVLYVQPPNFIQQLRVQLVSGGSVVAQSGAVQVLPLPHNTFIVGVLAPESPALSMLGGVTLSNRGRAVAVPLTLDDLPERYEPLRSLDCLVLSGVDTSALTPEQGRALQTWVETGGWLFVGGGLAAERTLAGLPAALRPEQVAGVVEAAELDALGDFTEVPVQAAGPFPVALADASDMGWRTLIEQGSQALLARADLGTGWTEYFALDPGGAPFDAWAGVLPFWQRVLEPGSALPSSMPTDVPFHIFQSEGMVGALTNLPGLQLPSVNWLAAMLGVYIVLIGPLNYLVLRRLRRLALAWVTIPVLTLLFSAGGYALGYGLRGTDLTINQVSIITYPSPDSGGLVRSYVGLLSPARSAYTVQVEGGALVSMMTRDYGWSGGAGSGYSRLDVLQGSAAGETSLVRNLEVNQWSMQYFQAEQALPGTAALQADVEIDGNHLRGTLRNTLGVPVEGVIFISGRSFAHLGDLQAGEERQISATLKSDDQGYLVGALFEGVSVVDPRISSVRPWSSAASGVDPNRVTALRQQVLQAYLAPAGDNPIAPGGMLLLGWADVRPIDVSVSRAGRAVRATILHAGLVVSEAPLPVEAGRVTVPAGHMQARLTHNEGDAGECGSNGRFYVSRGELTAEFQLPPSLVGLQVAKLNLRISSWDQSIATVPALQLYDWSTQTWVALPQVTRMNVLYDLADPESFIDPASGVLTLEAQSDSQSGTCYQFDFSMEGQLP